MKTSLRQNQQGVAHILLIVLIVIVVAAVGFVGWRVFNNNKKSASKSSNPQLAAAASAAETACISKYHDKDLCKFVSTETAQPFDSTSSIITMSGTSNGVLSTIVMKSDGKGNTDIRMAGSGETFNSITYNNITYTQTTAGGPWVTYGPSTASSSSSTDTSSDIDSSLKDFMGSLSTTSYTKIGTEACDNLTCFKYQIKDAATPDSTQYAWFDKRDYLLRQYSVSDTSGSMTMKISYQKVTISMPSPVENLSAPGQ